MVPEQQLSLTGPLQSTEVTKFPTHGVAKGCWGTSTPKVTLVTGKLSNNVKEVPKLDLV